MGPKDPRTPLTWPSTCIPKDLLGLEVYKDLLNLNKKSKTPQESEEVPLQTTPRLVEAYGYVPKRKAYGLLQGNMKTPKTLQAPLSALLFEPNP